MLRHLDVSRRALACLWVSGSIACSSAAPVDVGNDYAEPPAPVVEPIESDDPPLDTPEPSNADFPESISGYDAFIDSGWERGEVSPYCRTSFQACGGTLAGTWVVEDNCNPVTRSRDVLLSWGKAQMSLDETACWDAVQRLTWNWTGQLKFERGKAIDNRERAQRVDMELNSSCLSATFGIVDNDSVAPEICAALEDQTTSCALAGGVCMCSNRTVAPGQASGVYGVLGTSVAIGGSPTTMRYEYCVDGDRLLWRESEGAQRQVVMRRTADGLPGDTDPELPR